MRRDKLKIILEQLNEMIEMQKELDKYIMDKQGISYSDVIKDKIKIALFVELGELMNEFPTHFKYWKPNAKDNRDKGLVEFVDCMHFTMSLFYHGGYETKDTAGVVKIVDCFCNLPHVPKTQLKDIFDEYDHYNVLLIELLKLGHGLGFTWEEIYNAYIEKNKVNYDRQVNVEEYVNHG